MWFWIQTWRQGFMCLFHILRSLSNLTNFKYQFPFVYNGDNKTYLSYHQVIVYEKFLTYLMKKLRKINIRVNFRKYYVFSYSIIRLTFVISLSHFVYTEGISQAPYCLFWIAKGNIVLRRSEHFSEMYSWWKRW